MTDASLEPSLPPPWWERWPGRLEAELARFEHHGLPVTLIEDPNAGDGRLVVETFVDLPVRGRTRLLVLYPDGFPQRRFSIAAPDVRLSRHQAFGGDLCVIPRGAEHWHPKFMGADFVIHRVPRLVALVDAGGDALRAEEDPQGEPLTTYYNSPLLGGVIVEDRCLVPDFASGVEGWMRIHFTPGAGWLSWPEDPPDDWRPGIGQGLLISVKDSSGQELLEGASPDALLARFPDVAEGRWVFVSEPPYAESPTDLWNAACGASTSVRHWAQTTNGRQIIGLCTREEVRHGEYQTAWVFVTREVTVVQDRRAQKKGNPQNRGPRRIEGELVFLRALRWGDEDLGVRIPELAPLRERTVTVFGLGSLGAPFVQEMAKSRIGSLRMADHDHIDAGTSVRYPLGLEQAGIGKWFALARWVQLHNPEVRVDTIPMQVGSVTMQTPEVSERSALHRLMSGADLLVSATAEDDVNRQLDEVGLAYGVPRLFMWSQSGYGGVVALLEGGRTGCFHCLSLLVSEKAQSGTPAVEVPMPVDGVTVGTIQGRGCADKTFTATHADLLPIAIQAARVAYGRLCGPAGGYPAMQGDVFTVQIRRPDGQPIPPSWSTFDLPPRPDCPLCNPS
ncbi:ThiF family adenylyltransferase [Pedococcus sp. P5_B7]